MMKYQRMQQERTALLNRGTRHWLDADGSEDAATAQHEAGHVLAAWRLGFNPTFVTIEPGAGYGGLTCFDAAGARAFDRCVVQMAGSEAECLFGGPDDGYRNDLHEALAIAGTITRTDEIVETVWRARLAARTMLKASFAPLTKIAIALLEKRSLGSSEIEQLLASSMQPDDDEEEESETLPFDDPILTRVLDPKIIRRTTDGALV